jgi:hypothetical protein
LAPTRLLLELEMAELVVGVVVMAVFGFGVAGVWFR